MDFLKGAKDLARNPLGIVALFISLIYGFASLLLDSLAEKLTVAERWPIILFVVIFPVLVLITFYKLVTKHHGKLYAPGDFKDDKSFLRTLSQEEQESRLEKEVKESFGEQKELTKTESEPSVADSRQASKEVYRDRKEEHKQFRIELEAIEKSVIDQIAAEHDTTAELGVGIGDTDANFDAFLHVDGSKFIFVEVKALRTFTSSMMILDRLLYSAVVADKFFGSKFKLILAVVYYFDESDLDRVEKIWRRRISNCPANIELRFIPKSEVKNA